MLMLHCILVIATITLQASVFASSSKNRQAESPLKRKLSQKDAGKKTLMKRKGFVAEVEKTFSFEEFVKYVKSKHEKGVQFKRMLEILSSIELNVSIRDKPKYVSTVKDWINKKTALPSFSLENPTNAADWDEKIKILKKALPLTWEKLNDQEVEFVSKWKLESLAEAKHTVHEKFLNGKPGDDTVELFTSLKSKDFDEVNGFLQNRDFHMKEICETISKKFFEPAVEFSSPYSNEEPLKEEYDCKIGNTNKSQWLHSIGLCEEAGNSEISYFRVAVAKVEETNDAAFKVHYFIAFDRLEKTPGNFDKLEITPGNSDQLEKTPGNSDQLEKRPENSEAEGKVKYQYGNSQVAVSFSATYDKASAFAMDTSSLRGEKGKEIGK